MGLFKMRKKKLNTNTMARKLISLSNPKTIVSEQFRTIRTNLNFSMPDKDLKTLLITSSSPGEGKSTISSNIAIVFAQEGKKVLLIDADMRKPTIHYTFDLKNTFGLSSVLTRQVELEQAYNKTAVEGLFVLTSGPIPPNPSELLASKHMDQIMLTVTEQFDIVIFDTPPVLSVTDAQIMSNKCDGTVLVVNSGVAEKAMVLKAKESLRASKGNLIGVILNNYKLERDHYYYQYYGNAK